MAARVVGRAAHWLGTQGSLHTHARTINFESPRILGVHRIFSTQNVVFALNVSSICYVSYILFV